MIISILLAILCGFIYSLFGYMYISIDKDINLYKPWKIFLIWLFWPIDFLLYLLDALGIFIILISVVIYVSILAFGELCYIIYSKVKEKLQNKSK
jgi:hypothetical protein